MYKSLSSTKKSIPSTGGKLITSPGLNLSKLDKDTDGSLNIADIGSGTFKTDFSNLSFQLVSSSTTSEGTLDLRSDAIGFKVCKG